MDAIPTCFKTTGRIFLATNKRNKWLFLLFIHEDLIDKGTVPRISFYKLQMNSMRRVREQTTKTWTFRSGPLLFFFPSLVARPRPPFKPKGLPFFLSQCSFSETKDPPWPALLVSNPPQRQTSTSFLLLRPKKKTQKETFPLLNPPSLGSFLLFSIKPLASPKSPLLFWLLVVFSRRDDGMPYMSCMAKAVAW